jgi:hypothetical protein
MANTEVGVDLVTRLKDKGFKDLQKQSKASDKVLGALSSKLAAVFSVGAIIKFSKESVKAFTQDDKAAKTLTRTLGNLGLAFDDMRVKTFLGDLEKTSGVLDDKLRPAFQTLITTTGSVTKSQDLLTLALDVSAGSSVDLVTVAQDLSRAYTGNTRGLKKYSLGLSDAQLKTKNFEQIQGLLNKQFSGQNQVRLDSYEGKVAQLGVAFANLQETVGKSLVNALETASGNQGVGGLVTEMENLGRQIANIIDGLDLLIGKIRELPVVGENLPGFFDVGNIPVVGTYLKLLDAYMEAQKIKPKPFQTGMSVTGSTDFYNKLERDRAAAEKAAAARLKKLQQEALRKEKLAQAEKKRTAEIERLKSAIQFRFDIDAINLQAALRRQLSQTDRDRALQLSALKISDYQTDEDAIKTLKAATEGRYDDAMNLEKVLQLLKTAGFASDKASIDALAALKPDIKFTDNLDDILAKLKAIIEGKYTINIGATISVPNVPGAGGTATATPGGGKFMPGGYINAGSDEAGTGRGTSIGSFYPKPGTSSSAITEAITGIIGNQNTLTANFLADLPSGLDANDLATARYELQARQIQAQNQLTNYLSGARYQMMANDVTDQNTMTNQLAADRYTAMQNYYTRGSEPVVVNVNIEGSLLSQNDLVAAVTDAVYQTQRTGNDLIVSAI